MIGNVITSIGVGGTVERAELNLPYTLPAADGSSNQVLQTDGSGTLSWGTKGTGGNHWSESSGSVYRSSGKVGIGITVPTYKLHIKENGGSDAGLLIEASDTSGIWTTYINSAATSGFRTGIDSNEKYLIHDNENGATRFTIDASGNVGIGTTVPEQILHLKSTGSAIQKIEGVAPQIRFIESDQTLPAGAWRFAADGDVFRLDVSTGGEFSSFESPFKIKSSAPQDAFLIDTSGNIGIGTTVPSEKLQLSGAGTQRLAITQTTDSVTIKVKSSATGGYLGTSTSHSLTLQTGDSNRVTIDSTGKVGIGTTEPSAKLHVNGSVAFQRGGNLTITAGEITATHSVHFVDTESSALEDDLDTINGGVDGQILVLKAVSNDHTVVLKDDEDNLRLAGDFSMDTGNDTITLMSSGGLWFELSRSDNA